MCIRDSSLPKEVETLSLIQELLKTKRVCVPKVNQDTMDFYEIDSLDDLKEGYFHVLEPTTTALILPEDIDCMLVPMLAFDKQKYRVGYGKGFYDKYFARGYHGYKLGLAFSFQYVCLLYTSSSNFSFSSSVGLAGSAIATLIKLI